MCENVNYKPNPGSPGESWCFDNDDSYCDKYGRLYNWDAAMNGEGSSTSVPSGVKGVCPPGWHFPSDQEWMLMEIALGLTPAEANAQGWRGTDEGSKMKTSTWGGNNSSGFTALSSGRRDIDAGGSFNFEGIIGFWWTSTEINVNNNLLNARLRYLRDNNR